MAECQDQCGGSCISKSVFKLPEVVKKKGSGLCTHMECVRGASFNTPGETKGIYCAAHKKDGMENLRSKRCLHDGCKTRASFNTPGETRVILCAAHKKEGMEDLGNMNKRCIHEGCKKQSVYNIPGETKGIYCAAHKKDGMEDVKSKRCLHDGCNTIPSFNTPGETKGIYCADHKKEGMMNLKGKRCQQEGCEKQAHYNTPGESIGVSCSPHKKDGMVNVTCKRCEHDECNKHPSFNTPGETKGIYCADHKKEGMMNLKGKRCHQEGCDKISNYNTPGETKGIYCVAHKKAGMEDVKNTRCKLCPMRVTNKYSGYCYRCYIHKYPDSPILRNHKTKERHVADFVRGAFPEYEFKFDQRVSDGCSKRRPDILLDMGAFVLIIEIDENQHQDYDCSCENKRLMEIFRDCGSRSMAFLRFNPDDYVNSTGKRIASCWGITKDRGLFTVKENKKSEWSTRLNALVDTIKMQLDLEERKDIDVVHLFYDEKNVRTFRNI